jgi:hypothetical protein
MIFYVSARNTFHFRNIPFKFQIFFGSPAAQNHPVMLIHTSRNMKCHLINNENATYETCLFQNFVHMCAASC